MQRAALATFNTLLQTWPKAHTIRVYCGIGNNGGDGYVIARLAKQAGMTVEVVPVGDRKRLKGDALTARQDWLSVSKNKQSAGKPDVIVDALLGTGLSRPPLGEWKQAIEYINSLSIPVISVDTPSGLETDSGNALGTAIIADKTVTYIGLKQGLLTGSAKDYTGKLEFDALNLPEAVYTSIIPIAERLSHSLVESLLPPRKASAHKGDYGHAFIIGGSPGMRGAAYMAAEACARCGSGLTTVTSDTIHPSRYEIMTCSSDDHPALKKSINKATVLGIGPGLGTSPRASTLLEITCESKKPMVLDADALNILAQTPRYSTFWILTPHPGEAARLLGTTTTVIQSDRINAVQAIQQKYGGICVLKGFGTLIYDGITLSCCTAGNPGMASGGMGDVLTGIISGLLAQQLSLHDAARVGVYIHSHAADLAARKKGERGLLATDLFAYIRMLVNPGRS